MQIQDSIDKGITKDLLATNIRQPSITLGEITGEITHDEIPSRMYDTFCIGK
jgi:tRNA modification GTPase